MTAMSVAPHSHGDSQRQNHGPQSDADQHRRQDKPPRPVNVPRELEHYESDGEPAHQAHAALNLHLSCYLPTLAVSMASIQAIFAAAREEAARRFNADLRQSRTVRSDTPNRSAI